MLKIIPLFALATLAPQLAYAEMEKSYLCITDKVTGFSYSETRGWAQTSFNADGKYLIQPAQDIYEKSPLLFPSVETDHNYTPYTVKNFGSDNPYSFCVLYKETGYLRCDNNLQVFKFSTKTLRFLSSYTFGYLFAPELSKSEDPNDNTPSIEIGTCSPL